MKDAGADNSLTYFFEILDSFAKLHWSCKNVVNAMEVNKINV